MKHSDIQKKYPDFVIYETDDNSIKVSVRLDEETVWLTQKQLAEIFDTTRENVVQHIKNILQEGELPEYRTCKKFLQVQTEGSRQLIICFGTSHKPFDSRGQSLSKAVTYVGNTIKLNN